MSQPNEVVTELYIHMYDFLLDYAQRRLSNLCLAEEAVQETFRIAWIKQDVLCDSMHPKGWLVNTLKNVISNIRNNQITANRATRDYLTANCHNIAITEDSIRVEILFGDMAESEELKLMKEVADGYSYLEMAEKRRISVASCRKRVQRAREVLKNFIGNDVTNWDD